MLMRFLIILLVLFTSCKKEKAGEALGQADTVDKHIVDGNPISSNNMITVQVEFATPPNSPQATFTELPFDKKLGFMFEKDDGGVGDYNTVYPVMNGGTAANGVTYPGFHYSDNAGVTRKAGFSFAICGANHEGQNNTITTWDQYREMLKASGSNIGIMNHSYDHSNTPNAFDQLKRLHDKTKTELGIDLRTIVMPAGLSGFVSAGINLNYLLWSSEGYGGPDLNSADGYAKEIHWSDYFNIATLSPKRMIGTRVNLDTYWVPKLANFKAWVDNKFDLAFNQNKKIVACAFSHGPNGSEAVFLNEIMQYILSKPQNSDVWFPNAHEFAEYMEVKEKAVKSAIVIKDNTATFTINLSNLPVTNYYKNMSLKLTGGTVSKVVVSGADSYSVNKNAGLINIYKKGYE
jgi:hypothetical protein